MRNRIRPLRPAALAAALALAAVAAACGGRTEGERPPAPGGSADSAARLPAGSELGAPVGDRDSLVNAIAPRLALWVAMWRKALPGFAADSLVRLGESPALRGGNVQPLDMLRTMIAGEPVFEILSDRSPDHRHRLVFDWYQRIVESEDAIELGGEPDSSPLLIDLQEKRSHQFEFCGPSCGYHWGRWIDATRFVLAGWSEDDGGIERRGFLSVYSLADSTRVQYVTRPVSPAAFARYQDAWESWVRSRYRDWKSRRAGA